MTVVAAPLHSVLTAQILGPAMDKQRAISSAIASLDDAGWPELLVRYAQTELSDWYGRLAGDLEHFMRAEAPDQWDSYDTEVLLEAGVQYEVSHAAMYALLREDGCYDGIADSIGRTIDIWWAGLLANTEAFFDQLSTSKSG